VTPAEIGSIGEGHVTAWLQSRGYSCYRNTQLPGSTDIEANGQVGLLVQVKTAVYPLPPAELSNEEQRNIVARANRSGRQAWLARVNINNVGSLVGQINWKRLN
jgi:hypothetical protein